MAPDQRRAQLVQGYRHGHIAWMWEVAAILDAHDVKTEMIRTERPGYILYEDEFQITAEPFADTPT